MLIMLSIIYIFTYLIAVHSLEVNVTGLSNCNDVDVEWPVRLINSTLDCDENNLCRTVSAFYEVKIVDPRQVELITDLYQCQSNYVGVCNERVKRIVTQLNCDKFTNDDSGPWHIISSSMTDSKCGKTKGVFYLDNLQLSDKTLQRVITNDKEKTKYRIRMQFHKIGEDEDQRHLRACINLGFNVLKY